MVVGTGPTNYRSVEELSIGLEFVDVVFGSSNSWWSETQPTLKNVFIACLYGFSF
jgi:hypothetical protein